MLERVKQLLFIDKQPMFVFIMNQPFLTEFYLMILYGIPNCDTVRKARKFLSENNIQYTFHDFRKDGLTVSTIQHWLESQPIEALVNKRSTSWKQITNKQQTELMSGKNLEILTELPTLIKRPVLETDTQLMLGFNAAEYETLV